MRRLRRYLPDGWHYHYAGRRGSRPATAAGGRLTASRPGPVYRRRAQDRAGDGKGRGRLLALRPVRRALSHRCLGHAEISHRYDLRRFIMPVQKPISSVNDFVVRFANVNGSGLGSATELFARLILGHGVPVSPRNIFPSNIQGLPTWYEVRVTEDGHLGARGGVDMMVAMNPQTWDSDLASIEPGGYLFYDSTKPMPSSKFRADITVIGVPLTAITNSTYTDPRQRQLVRVVPDHAIVVACRRLRQPLQETAARSRNRQGKVRHRPGRGRTGFDRHSHWCVMERRACLHRHLRPRHLADAGVHRPVLLRRDSGGHHERAARRSIYPHAAPNPAKRHHCLRPI